MTNERDSEAPADQGSLQPSPSVPGEGHGTGVVGWQPIETAPRDGRWLLLEGEMSGGDTSTVRVGRWNPTYSDATRCTYEWQCVDPYAHGTDDETVEPEGFWNWYADGRVSGWQPLPPPPADSVSMGTSRKASEPLPPVEEVNAELLAAAVAVEAVMAKNVYPQPDKPDSAWAKLQALRAAISKATATRNSGDEG